MSSSCSLSSLDKFLFKMSEDKVESTPVVSEAQTDSSCELVLKQCTRCLEDLTLDQFSKNSGAKDGLNNWCKTCYKKIHAERKRPRDDMEPCDDTCDIITEANDTPDSLYVMENPRIPGEIKIGRSQSPENRAKQLSTGHNFRLIVKYSYGERGS